MQSLALLCLLGAACLCHGQVMSNDCALCVCNMVSGCDLNIGCSGTTPVSCGPYQITLSYYCDANNISPGQCDSYNLQWQACAEDFTCATDTVQAYMQRWGDCYGLNPTCQEYAQLHAGGPNAGFGCPIVSLPGVIEFGQGVAACCTAEYGTPNC